MKNVAIVSQGITGLTAVKYLNLIKAKFKLNFNINFITKEDVVGEFSKGGAKYIHDSECVRRFFNESEIHFSIKKINGSVYVDNVYGVNGMYSYPDIFYYLGIGGGIGLDSVHNMQSLYYLNTRGNNEKITSEQIYKCMNEPWIYRNNLQLSIGDMDMVISSMQSDFDSDSINVIIDNNFDRSKYDLGKYDLVIFCMPIQFLLDDEGKSEVFNYTQLKLLRYSIESRLDFEDIWWDYCYVVSDKIRFTRLSVDRVGRNLDIEYGLYENLFDIEIDRIHLDVYKFFSENLGSNIIKKDDIPSLLELNRGKLIVTEETTKKIIEVISEDEINEHKNVFLLGRYAEWNSRITWKEVIERLYDNEEYFMEKLK